MKRACLIILWSISCFFVAYGNGFEDGYRGKNLSGTPWGLKWDFILVHESGHEWFGNSITANSWQQGWVHEGFTKSLCLHALNTRFYHSTVNFSRVFAQCLSTTQE